MKDACYFSHDANAKDDYKCMLLIDQMGPEGYGIFWVLIETLREQKNYKYPLQLVPSLARKYNTTQAKMETVISAYGLFEIDEQNFFFSGSLNRRMSFLEQKREKIISASLRGVAARKVKQEQQLLGLSDYNSTNHRSTNDTTIGQPSKEKESKEKESKEKFFKLNPKPNQEQEQGSDLQKPKVKLNLSQEAAELRQKLLNSKYVGTCAEVMVEGEKEYVFINEQGRLYTKSRTDKQLVSSTLNEIWEQLHELHVAKYGAKTNSIQNLQIKKFGA